MNARRSAVTDASDLAVLAVAPCVPTTLRDWCEGYEDMFSVPAGPATELFAALFVLSPLMLEARARELLAPYVTPADLEIAIGAALAVQSEGAFARGELADGPIGVS